MTQAFLWLTSKKIVASVIYDSFIYDFFKLLERLNALFQFNNKLKAKIVLFQIRGRAIVYFFWPLSCSCIPKYLILMSR